VLAILGGHRRGPHGLGASVQSGLDRLRDLAGGGVLRRLQVAEEQRLGPLDESHDDHFLCGSVRCLCI
jgi:hypothetical protein